MKEFILLAFLSVLVSEATTAAPPDELLTVAEASDFTRTSTSDEVMDLLRRLDARSAHMYLTEFGRSVEGRPLPLAILADPPITSPEEARASGKVIIFVFANIHAGEVAGKEALLMLNREIVLDEAHPWLNDAILLIAPNYNPDGNDRMAPDNRPGQVGPEEMGTRTNAQGLDLNRDYMKLDAPESRAMVRLLNEWDPHLVFDLHTTNGFRHRYTLTYDVPLNPSSHPAPVEFLRQRQLPAVTERLRERTGYETFYYGNFNREHTAWWTYSAQPRFGGSYHGLRGTMSILVEAYSYATYRDRIQCTREFLRECIDYTIDHTDEIKAIHERARQETIEAGRSVRDDDRIGFRHEIAAFDEPVTILGYRRELAEDGSYQTTDEPHDYEVAHYGRFEPTIEVVRPLGYLIPPGFDAIVDHLHRHGIRTESF